MKGTISAAAATLEHDVQSAAMDISACLTVAAAVVKTTVLMAAVDV